MKLHYPKILIFSLPLCILVSSSYAHNNKPYIKAHTSTTIWRGLSESDPYMPNYDNDAEMKSVKENFDRQTSQRFDEYEERMKGKRQKRKEERDKNIQEIIEKDRMDKSLAEKVEKGCLRCGCGLGGVTASVGLFGELGIYGWNAAATATAMAEGAAAAKAAGEAAHIAEGIKAVISGIESEFSVSTVGVQGLQSLFTAQNYNNVTKLALAINEQYKPSSCIVGISRAHEPFCSWVKGKFVAAKEIPGNVASTYNSIEVAVKSIVLKAESVAETAAEKATEEAIKNSIAVVEAKYVICQNAIIASVGALLIIVLVMIIIYLVLRYRRKNKMNKKAHYTKLLKE